MESLLKNYMNPNQSVNYEKVEMNPQPMTPRTIPVPKPLKSITNQSSTVLSNANIIENVIPDLKRRLSNLKQKGLVLHSDGITRHVDGSLWSMPPQQ